MQSVEVFIAGGGASGMMAAIESARGGAEVILLEKKPRLGKKLLATGNGRCNYTNLRQKPDCYRSSQEDFPWKVVSQFDEQDTIAWFETIGILPKNRNGYIYPHSGQAASVLRALEREIKRLNIEVHTEEWLTELLKDFHGKAPEIPKGFTLKTNRGVYRAEKVILSMGGKASPVHGSTGDGYRLAESMGHHLVTPLPALTSLLLEEHVQSWGGARLDGAISLYDEKGNLLCSDNGEIQMVSSGISGIPVFQLSRYAAVECRAGRKPYLVLDSIPEKEEKWFYQELKRRKSRSPSQTLKEALEGIFPDRFIGVLLKQSGISIKDTIGKTGDNRLRCLAATAKKMKLTVKAVNGFEKAQVTAGGISVSEVDAETLESKLCPDLYLTGEILDVDGMCGGYNLQWAWSTGYLAGKAAAFRKRELLSGNGKTHRKEHG